MTWTPRPSSQFPEWGGVLCRPHPRWSHREWTSVLSFRASSLSGHSSGRSCDRSGPGRPWPASLSADSGSGWGREGWNGGRAWLPEWFYRCPCRRLGSSSSASTAGHRGAARCWESVPFCFWCSQAWGGRFHGHIELLTLVPPLARGDGVFDWLCWGLTTRQPLRVILCRLPEKGRKEIEERVEEMKERDREERGTGMKVKKQKK